MSWYLLPDDIRYLPFRYGAPAPSASRSSARATGSAPSPLGTAFAGRAWSWAPTGAAHMPADERRPRTDGRVSTTVVRIPDDLLRRMAEAARFTGRGEHEVWAEAARQWLSMRALDDDPQPPTPAAAAQPRPHRSWASIDALLADLRVVGRLPLAGERGGKPGSRGGSSGSSAA
jgi:hypothetical protein